MSHSRVPDTYLDAYYGFWFKDGLTMRDILPKVGNKQTKNIDLFVKGLKLKQPYLLKSA